MASNDITIHVSSDYNSAGTDKAKKATEELGTASQKSSKKMTEGHEEVVNGLGGLGNQFRYLSLVVGATSGAMMLATKSFVDSYKEYERGMLGLNVMAKTTGQSMEDATGLATKYAQTGLMSISEAAMTVQNLLASGLNLDQVDTLMKGTLDTAVFLHEEMYTTGSAMEKMSFGFRVLNERNIDAVGINQKLTQTYKDYEAVIGKTTNQFNELDRHMAVYNKLVSESKRFTGGANFAMNTFSGTLDRLSANIEIFKIRMGEALLPVIGTLAENITNLVTKFTDFISKNKEVAAALQVGLVMLTTFTAAIAMAGALLPMLILGFTALKWSALLPMIIAGVKATAVILALVVALGGLAIMILKITGKWDKWTNSLKRNIALISDVFKTLPDVAAKASAASLESYAKFTSQLAKENRDYEESLMELARKHSQTIDKLKADLLKLETDEKKYLDRRTRDYAESMADMEEAHKDRIDDLTRDLECEESLGIRADQEKLRDLREAIEDENKEYAKDKKRKQRDYDEDVADHKESTKEKKNSIIDELNVEYELRKKHKEEYQQWRNFAFLDEFEKMKRTHEERIAQLDEQVAKLGLTEEQIAGIDNQQANVNDTLESTNTTLDEMVDKLIKLGEESDKNTEKVKKQKGIWESIGQFMGEAMSAPYGPVSGPSYVPGIEKPLSSQDIQKFGMQGIEGIQVLSDAMYGAFQNFMKGFRSYQLGGIVPGFPNERVPAILHGGERVIPSNQLGELAPITININNPIIRKSEDLQEMGRVLEKVLARNNELRKLGAR